ncbi:unnamed protein product [Protopolystoma xenopodis]|uniref:Uncharacterized protein n=1 Tax=Protopolystoma xenopodis TaxID=117903 RepID=A0A3S5APW2_9PLAT|nr:unnamed protein product [Protopolystoma xenopodis]
MLPYATFLLRFPVITLEGEPLRYRQLDVLEFDSERKCMSVVLQAVSDPEDSSPALDPTQPVLVLCKGAETSILSRVIRQLKAYPLSTLRLSFIFISPNRIGYLLLPSSLLWMEPILFCTFKPVSLQ